MLTLNTCETAIASPFFDMNFADAEKLFAIPHTQRYRAAGPGSEDAADEENGPLDLPVNPDEGADQIPEQDHPVPS